MDSGFKDPIASDVKKKKVKSPWNFDAPNYNESMSCFVNAGTHYGSGKKQPIGHEGNPKSSVDVMPMKSQARSNYHDGKTTEIRED